MTKLSIYKKMLMVFFIAGIVSCKKSFLELTPLTQVDPGVAMGTEADVLIALRGAYANMRAVDLYGRTVPVLGDIMADNIYQHALNTNRYTAFNSYNFNTTDGNALGLWTSSYSAILRANQIINSSLPTSINMDQYRGEAYSLRALCYFTLVRYFARPYTDNPNGIGVPIVTAYDPELKPARSTVAEVYTLILDDLNKAYTMMTKYTNSSQFSKYAARALQAKVHLTKGDMTNAKTAAVDVITNGGFSPLTTVNHGAYWTNAVIRTDKLETLYEVSADAVGNLAFDGLSYIYSQAGNYGDLVVSAELMPAVTFTAPPAASGGATATGLVNLNATGNVVSVTITNPGSGYGTAPTVGFSITPFAGGTLATGTATVSGGGVTSVTITNPGAGYTEFITPGDVRRALYPNVIRSGTTIASVNKFPVITGDVSDTKVLRLSEMYLIAAEASLPGNEADALMYVNYITSRRGAPAIASTGAALFEDIIKERRKELLGEGDRYMDLMRLKRDVVRSNNYPSAVRTVLYSNFRRILPIPQTELDANPAIRTQQNPGY
jgi:Starch-binding associating with outer membrane/SusD family